MANIINSSANLDKKTIYFLTRSKNTMKMSECDGQVIEVKAWAIYEDADYQTQEMKQVLAILTEDGETLATVSGTFIRDFLDIVDVFGEDLKKIKIMTGKTKNNRTFVTCDYAE